MTVRYARVIARRACAGATTILWSFGLCFLLFVNPGFVSAAECTSKQAKEKAQSRHGGNAIEAWVDGDYFIVRLQYGDGAVIEVGIDRWSC